MRGLERLLRELSSKISSDLGLLIDSGQGVMQWDPAFTEIPGCWRADVLQGVKVVRLGEWVDRRVYNSHIFAPDPSGTSWALPQGLLHQPFPSAREWSWFWLNNHKCTSSDKIFPQSLFYLHFSPWQIRLEGKSQCQAQEGSPQGWAVQADVPPWGHSAVGCRIRAGVPALTSDCLGITGESQTAGIKGWCLGNRVAAMPNKVKKRPLVFGWAL